MKVHYRRREQRQCLANDQDRRPSRNRAEIGDTITVRIVSSDAKATTSVVSDALLLHEPQLVRRGHRQRGRRQVHLLRWR